MSGRVTHKPRIVQPSGWFDQLETLLARELAPSPRKFRTALRIATIGTIGAGVVASCHVNNELGTYFVWLLAGAGPMMSVQKALPFLAAEGIALATSVMMARALAETPWLMLPFLFALISFFTYLGAVRKLGAALLLIEVVSLNSYYGVVFAPQAIGWGAAGAFGGSAIAFGVLVLFDNWLWPDPAEALLMESLGTSLAHARSRLLAASAYFLDNKKARRPALPPPTSDLPAHMGLLEQAIAEGLPEHRRAILLAAITRMARIALEVDRLTIAARQHERSELREMLRPEILATVDAIGSALDEIARELPSRIAVGVDQPAPASRTRARLMMDRLSARTAELRPTYTGRASSGELENFASFADSLATLTDHIERLLDEPPPERAAASAKQTAPGLFENPDPEMVRYALKVGLCAVVGYVIAIITNRSDLSTILITVLITALPTYGAALRKMILRIIGAVIGGILSLIAIMIVSPNFETLPAYMLAVAIVFFISAYGGLATGRVAYAGKQIGTTFALVFTGLSPAIDVYEPLWRIWGILLGTFVVAIAALVLWPEYAGDSLLPRLRRVIRDTLALAPGAPAASSEAEIHRVNSDTMRVLAEILEVADDAQLEGRASMVNHNAIVEAAGTLRRIANRFGSISAARIVAPTPPLDPDIESAREAVIASICGQLQSWLGFFESDASLNLAGAQAIARGHAPEGLRRRLEHFRSRLEERDFARIEAWTTEQRRTILAELQSMRRLEVLITDLNRWLAQIPGPASQASLVIPVPANPARSPSPAS
jgi:uncharacterized membrane protein YccC